MKRILLLTTLVATGLALAPMAEARGPAGMMGGMMGGPLGSPIGGMGHGPMAESFADLDGNGDGSLTPEEFASAPALRFARMDTDGNGELSAQEMLAAQDAWREARRQARAERMIARADTDGNGTLSAEELANARPEARQHRSGWAERHGQRHDRKDRAERGKRSGGKDWSRRDRQAGQGAGQGERPDREAFRAAMQERLFDMIDTNDDGAISEQEFETAKAFMAQRGFGHGRPAQQ